MRTRLVLCLGCTLAVCGKPPPAKAPLTDQQRAEQWYKEWAARQPRPTPELIDHIEAALAREPCIGDLKGWSRSYAYNMLPEKTVDTGIVDFHLTRVGAENVKAGRQITVPFTPTLDEDNPRIKAASGDYDLKENRIHLAFCGISMGPRQPYDVDDPAYFDDLKRRRRADGTATPPAQFSSRSSAPLPLRPDNPTSDDKAVLRRIAEQCHLHPGALSFVQYQVPLEPVIRTTRAYGDTDAQLDCAIQHLPGDFMARFGLEFEAPK